MAGVLAQDGADYWLNLIKTNSGNYSLRLFTNNVTPAATSTASTFTEATGGGYSAITLTPGSSTVSSHSMAWAEQSFSFSGQLTTNTTVYGWYILNSDGNLQGAGLLSISYIPEAGGYVKLTPSFPMV